MHSSKNIQIHQHGRCHTLPDEQQNGILWREFKIDGSNITSRSYAAIVVHDDILYVYGGYQVAQGILSSFYSMPLDKPNYKWNEIKPKINPGPLTKHSMFAHNNALYLQGGQTQTNKQSNTTHHFDIATQIWSKLPINATYPQPFDNHASVYLGDMVAIFGGYSAGKLENTLRFYHISNNEWSAVKCSHHPQAREGCGLSHGNQKLYLFGGTNGQTRLNDLWTFDLKNSQWQAVHIPRNIHPNIRNGFAFDYWQDKLVLFGGIHDITWELDDLWTMDVTQSCWTQLEEDTTRRVEINLSPSKLVDDALMQSSKNINKHSQSNSPNRFSRSPKHLKQVTMRKINESIIQTKTLPNQLSSDGFEQKARHKTLDDQRKKEFELKKMDMLKLFDVSESMGEQLRSRSPTSETMRDALLLIGSSALKTAKLTDFGKQTISKFMLPLKNGSNTFLGKRPCARDGHKSSIYKNYLIIFGGDRHQMSFNDIHALDLHFIQ